MWKFCTTSKNSELLQRYGFQKCTWSNVFAFSCLFYENRFHISKERKQNVLLMHTITFFKYTIMFRNDLRAMHYKEFFVVWRYDNINFLNLCTKKVCVVNIAMYYIEQTSDYIEILHQITQTPRITDS